VYNTIFPSRHILQGSDALIESIQFSRFNFISTSSGNPFFNLLDIRVVAAALFHRVAQYYPATSTQLPVQTGKICCFLCRYLRHWQCSERIILSLMQAMKTVFLTGTIGRSSRKT